MKLFNEYIDGMKKRGVVTAHNPMGHKLPDAQNKHANQQLYQFLVDRGHQPHPVTGTYNGHEEDAFEIQSIGLGDLKKIGRKFNQKAVIWGNEEVDVK